MYGLLKVKELVFVVYGRMILYPHYIVGKCHCELDYRFGCQRGCVHFQILTSKFTSLKFLKVYENIPI